VVASAALHQPKVSSLGDNKNGLCPNAPVDRDGLVTWSTFISVRPAPAILNQRRYPQHRLHCLPLPIESQQHQHRSMYKYFIEIDASSSPFVSLSALLRNLFMFHIPVTPPSSSGKPPIKGIILNNQKLHSACLLVTFLDYPSCWATVCHPRANFGLELGPEHGDRLAC